MGKIDESLCYLIGSIEYSNDQGQNWRKELIDKCRNSNLDINFLNPTDKLTGLQPEIGSELDKVQNLKKQGKWDELSQYMRSVVRQDHRCVDLSDFVIFRVDPSIHTCGSYFEFSDALRQKKPYKVIVDGGKHKTPAWLFGILDHNNIFSSVDEVVEDLINIDQDKVEMSDRWVLIRKQINEM